MRWTETLASGLATGLGTLVLVRVVMGFADGAYTPASIAATLDAAPPERHGLAIGLQQMMLPAMAPITTIITGSMRVDSVATALSTCCS